MAKEWQRNGKKNRKGICKIFLQSSLLQRILQRNGKESQRNHKGIVKDFAKEFVNNFSKDLKGGGRVNAPQGTSRPCPRPVQSIVQVPSMLTTKK